MDLDIGYIIINPDKNPSSLRISMSSIQRHAYSNPEIIEILPKNTSPADLKKHKDIYPDVFKGSDTITSLINTGFKKLKAEWGVVVFAGSVIKTNLARKYSKFATSEKDIFFPIMDGKWNVVDGSTNGLTINKKFFAEIGEFPENQMWKSDEESSINSFEVCKFMWAQAAIEKKCVFKAVVGCKFN